ILHDQGAAGRVHRGDAYLSENSPGDARLGLSGVCGFGPPAARGRTESGLEPGGSASPVRPKVQQPHGRFLQFGGSTPLRLIGKNLYSSSYESLMGKNLAAFVCLSMPKDGK